jgi:hypothetical protein
MKSPIHSQYLGISWILLVALLTMSFKKNGCNKEQMLIEAVDRLKKYTLIQDYPFYMKKNKKGEAEYVKQLITLNRGVRYKFYTIKNADYDGQPILGIYNNEKMEFLLGTTYNKTLQKFYGELEFECKTTGNYCLAFYFKDGLEGCGLGIFASLIKE